MLTTKTLKDLDREEIYHLIAEYTRDWEEWIGPDGNYIYVSPSCEAITGYRPDEFLANPNLILDIVHPADHDKLADHRLEELSGNSEGSQLDFRIIARNGDQHWISHRCQPIDHPGMGWLGNRNSNRDITCRKRTEEALRESERRYRTLVETMHYGVEEIDLDGTIQFGNTAFHRILGYDPGELTGLFIWDLIADDPEPLKAYLVRLVEEQPEPSPYFSRDRTKDGRIIDIQIDWNYRRDEQDRLIGFTAVITDITERNRAERALHDNKAAIDALINGPSDIVILADPQGVIQVTNEFMAKRMGKSTDELIGVCLWDLFTPQAIEFRKAIVDQVIRTGKPVRVEDPTPGIIYDTIVYPVFDSQGKITRIAILARDITERKRAEEALRQRDAMLRNILADAPITVLATDTHGNIELMEGRKLSPGERQDITPGQNVLEIETEWTEQVINLHRALAGEELTDRLSTPRGDTFDVRYAPIRNASGVISGATIVSTKITEYIEAQEEIRQAKNQLEGILQELEDAHAQLEHRITERTTELARTNQQLLNEIAERSQAEEKARQHAARAEALARVAARINARLDLKGVLQTVCEEAARAMHMSDSTVMLYDEERDVFDIAAIYGPTSVIAKRTTPLPRAVHERFMQGYENTLVIPDNQVLQGLHDNELITEYNVRTSVNITLLLDDQLIGSLNVYSIGEIQLPTEEEIEFVQALANQAATAIVNARMFEQISDSQKRLQALSKKLVETQEAERRHLSRELHDEIGQLLTSVDLELDIVIRSLKERHFDPARAQTELTRAHDSLKELFAQVHEISLDLRPKLLDDLGLLPALRAHLERYTQQTNIQVNFKHSNIDQRFTADIETAAFRIVQEALTNVVRHAEVDEVDVRLWADEGSLNLQVEDSGRGFDVQKAEAAFTGGLSSMRERAALCGGELEIESEPGHGTCLTAELPLVY